MDPKKSIIPFPEFHSEVNKVAKTLYETEHFTEALRSASIRFEEFCGEILKNKTGEELTGTVLMQRLFSVRDPQQKKANESEHSTNEENQDSTDCVFPLVNISTKNGIEKQKNFCNLYAGYMGTIRNTLAHTTKPLDDIEALYGLNIVSYLFYKLDSAIKLDSAYKSDYKPKIIATGHLKTYAISLESELIKILLEDKNIKLIPNQTNDKANAKLSIEKMVQDLIIEKLETIGEETYNLFFSDKNFQEKIYSKILRKIYE